MGIRKSSKRQLKQVGHFFSGLPKMEDIVRRSIGRGPL